MKEKMMPLLMLLAMIMATVMFYNKWHDGHDDLDAMQQALAGAQRYIKPGSSMTFENAPIKNELHFAARYWLTPSYLAFHAHTFDTVLSVYPLKVKDSITQAYTTANRKTLWQYADKEYCYMLTVKQ